jgi:hypothetical protein
VLTPESGSIPIWAGSALLLVLIACDPPNRTEDTAVVSFGNAAARACDLLFEVEEASEANVAFAEVHGAFFRRATRLGVSVAARRDARLADDSVTIRLDGNNLPILQEARCYDRAGRPLEKPAVRLSK